jgi:DNA processing protein
MTTYGRRVVDDFVTAFVGENITTISGFMYGVDTEVHKKTLEFGGRTVCVFGNGLDFLYPAENKDLYTEVLAGGGLVLSEYEKDAKPRLWTYPARNRIIALLSTIGVLVVEADLASGSLITAKIAAKLKKKVWAVPGPVTSTTSRGTNYLIQNGLANMATSPYDILVKSKKIERKKNENLNDLETEIYTILERESLSVDEISVILSKDIATVTSCLTLMALKGMVGEAGGRFYLTKN